MFGANPTQAGAWKGEPHARVVSTRWGWQVSSAHFPSRALQSSTPRIRFKTVSFRKPSRIDYTVAFVPEVWFHAGGYLL